METSEFGDFGLGTLFRKRCPEVHEVECEKFWQIEIASTEKHGQRGFVHTLPNGRVPVPTVSNPT